MSTRAFTPAIALLLSVALVVPAVFLIAPQKTYAVAPGVPTIGVGPVEIKTSVETTITAVKEALNLASTYTNTAANYANMINAYVLQPLAFVLSGNLMKALTAGVVNFVIGKANGTGAPQFVADVMASMQSVSDGAALAYLKQVGNTNSPFSSSIASALSANYLQKTTLAGFWAANMCTLQRSSPNVPAYLAGNWSQGGIAAWFSLTTQVQNNPYTLYQTANSQMATVIGDGIGGATGVRASQLSWGQGFMSWCGASEHLDTKSTPVCPDGSNYIAAENKCQYEDGSTAVAVSAKGTQSVNPGDPCTKSDGTPGITQTPGSTIKATLDKVLGGQQDQIVRMGNVGPQINQILGNIATVMQTINFASQLLGGSDSNSGLLSVGNTSASNPTSRLAQFAPYQTASGEFTGGYLGATQSSINADAASIATTAAANEAAGVAEAASAAAAGGNDPSDRVTQYETAWNTIRSSAVTASTNVTSLANFCTEAANVEARALLNSEGGMSVWFAKPNPTQQDLDNVHTTFTDAARAQASAALSVLSSKIDPVFAQVSMASTTLATARAAIQQASATASGATSFDVQTQISTPPTIGDVMLAQQSAQAYGGAVADPTGSLEVSRGSTVDQMNLISKNAAALKTTVCNAASSRYASYY